MIIRFEQSGGIICGGWAVTVDTARMDAHEARELEELVERADLFATPAHRSRSLPTLAVDTFVYDIRGTQGKRRCHLRLDDTEVPAELRPLIAYLAGLAYSGGRSGSP